MGDGPSLGWDLTQQQLSPAHLIWPSGSAAVDRRRVMGGSVWFVWQQPGSPGGNALPTQLYAHTASSWKLRSPLLRKLEGVLPAVPLPWDFLQLLPSHSSSQPAHEHGYPQRGSTREVLPCCQARAACLLLALASESEKSSNELFYSPVRRKGAHPGRGLREAVRCLPGFAHVAAADENRAHRDTRL